MAEDEPKVFIEDLLIDLVKVNEVMKAVGDTIVLQNVDANTAYVALNVMLKNIKDRYGIVDMQFLEKPPLEIDIQ